MIKKKETAEQQLLKLIEASSGAGSVAASVKTTKQVSRKQSLLSVVKTVNRFLLVGIIAVVALLVNEIIGGMELVNKKITFTFKPGSGKNELFSENVIPKIPGITFYLSQIEKRNFFQPYEKVETPTQSTVGQNQRLSQMVQRFKLVGISWMDQVDTASVMIEDKNKGVTHYRKKGEAIDGITVKDIYKDSALLGYENEEIIIKYDKPQM